MTTRDTALLMMAVMLAAVLLSGCTNVNVNNSFYGDTIIAPELILGDQ